MAEFVDYTLRFELKNGRLVQGVVRLVERQAVTLGDVKDMATGERRKQVVVQGLEVRDLKVVQVPARVVKAARARNSRAKPQLVDDAIVFSLANEGDAEASSAGVSRVATPRAGRKHDGRTVYEHHEEMWDTDTLAAVGTDFDFGSNLLKFDKQRVFEELRAQDTVAHGDRLVGHNRVEPKTKYENDEMVLRLGQDGWAGEPLRPQPLRQSLVPAGQAAAGAAAAPVRSAAPVRRANHLFSHQGLEAPVCTPVQLLEIERLCELMEIPAEVLMEAAAAGIFHVVVSVLGGHSRLATSNHNLPPLVVLLVGNNHTGARTLAAGRHMSNRGVRAVAFPVVPPQLLGGEDEEELDPLVKRQLQLFTRYGGKVFDTLELLRLFVGTLDLPVELIVDGIHGYDTNLSYLWGARLEQCIELIRWANLCGCGKLLVDIPTGLDPGLGQMTVDDLVVDAKWVVSMGLPVTGLLQAYRLAGAGMLDVSGWIHFLADVGVPAGIYKRGNLRKFDRVWFTDLSVVSLEVQLE